MADFRISQLPVAPDATEGDFMVINKDNTTTNRIDVKNLVEGLGDARYLRTDVAAGDQTVASTGTTTFDGLVEAGSGVKVTGGDYEDGKITLYKPGDPDGGILISKTNRIQVGNSGNSNGLAVSSENLVKNAEASNVRSQFFSTNHTAKVIGFKGSFSVDTGSPEAAVFNATTTTQTTGNLYGFLSEVFSTSAPNPYNFYSGGSAPNFFKGDTYIGGTTSRNTRELWESTLTEEQKEELAAGTFVVPANVSLPGDGSFARQWWYDQQDEETQALIDAGELEYPEHFAAATFTDTFDLDGSTAIQLRGDGDALFRAGTGNISIEGGANSLEKVIKFNRGGVSAANNPFLTVTATNTAGDGSKTVDPTYEITYSGKQLFYNGFADFRAITGSPNQATDSPGFLFRFNEDVQAGINSKGSLFKSLSDSPAVDSDGNSVTDLIGILVTGKIPTNVANDSFAGFRSSGEVEDGQTIAEFRSYDANAANISENSNIGIIKAFSASGYADKAAISYGYYSNIGNGTDSTKEKYNFYAAGDAPNFFQGLSEHASGVKVTGGTIDLTSANGEIAFGTDPLGTTNALQIKGANSGQWLKLYAGGLQVTGSNSRNGITFGGLYADTEYQSGNTDCQTFVDRCNYANVSGNTRKTGFYARPAGLSFSPSDTETYIGFLGNAPEDTSSGKGLSYNFYAATPAPNYFRGRGIFSSGIIADNIKTITSASSPGVQFNTGVQSPTGSPIEVIANYSFGSNAPATAAVFTRPTSDTDDTPVVQGFIGIIRSDERGIILDHGVDGSVVGTSDYRIKSNISPVANASSTVKALNPVSFDTAHKTGYTGFIAHELQEVVPRAVTGTKDQEEAIGTLADFDGTVLQTEVIEPPAEELEYTEEVETDGVSTQVVRTRSWTPTGTRPVYQCVDQTKLIPLLTKALQEALEEIDNLKSRLDVLEGN